MFLFNLRIWKLFDLNWKSSSPFLKCNDYMGASIQSFRSASPLPSFLQEQNAHKWLIWHGKHIKQESDFGDYYLENKNTFRQTDWCPYWTSEVNSILYPTGFLRSAILKFVSISLGKAWTLNMFLHILFPDRPAAPRPSCPAKCLQQCGMCTLNTALTFHFSK